MAQRIMFSTLPFLANPAQVALTEGVVDTQALKAAVEGRKNIVKYGVLAVLGELEHYQETLKGARNRGVYSIPYATCKMAIQSGDYEKSMDIALRAFAEPDSWYTNYGGRPWEMIARTIRQIARLDRQLDVVRQLPRSEKNDKQELQLMRDLIVEMNVFDGLAHNSDSILNNIAELEAFEELPHAKLVDRHKRHKENYTKLKRLMDAKELDSPVEVYKLIQDTLTGSGDIHKFKDWVTKMRTHKEYRQNDPKLIEKLFAIYLRKALMPIRADMNDARDELSKRVQTLESEWSSFLFLKFVALAEVRYDAAFIAVKEFEEYGEAFTMQYADLPATTIENEVTKISKRGFEICKNIKLELWALQSTSNKVSVYTEHSDTPDNVSEEVIKKAIDQCKEIISTFNQFSYFLDTL